MTIFDIILIAFFVINLWIGFAQGFVDEILATSCWVFSFVILFLFGPEVFSFVSPYIEPYLEDTIGNLFGTNMWDQIFYILFSILFFTFCLFMLRLLTRMLTWPLSSFLHGRVNHFLGFVLGGFKALIFLTLLWYGLHQFSVPVLSDLIEEQSKSSIIAPILDTTSGILDRLIKEMF